MWKMWLGGMLAHLGMLKILNSKRGEAGTKQFTQAEMDAKIAEATKGLLNQAQVDSAVESRLNREKGKFADYEELKEFKTKHEKVAEETTQKELEAKKEYEKAKEGYVKKQTELQGIITTKDATIADMTISGALMAEIVKQNAYAEETIALIKGQAVIDKDKNILIKGKDKNGQEVTHSVEEGIKKFLEARPHLVKAGKPGGGGTGAGGAGGGGGGTGGEDLDALNAEFLAAMNRGDRKRAAELKTKMSALLGSKKTQL